MKKEKVLIVDDEENIHWLFSKILNNKDFYILNAMNGKEAMDIFRDNSPDIVILDIKLPDINGLELLRELKKIDPLLMIIIITSYGTMDIAIEAQRLGAYDYLSKPFDIDEIKGIINRAFYKKRVGKDIIYMRPNTKNNEDSITIIGRSKQMQEVYKNISRAMNTDSTIIIQGESGTGKDLIAKAIHYNSLRKNKPFIVINCAAIPETLLESELFGYEKGAFTGAYTMKKGKFEQADGGTLFLDEIGEMPFPLQPKILRILEKESFTRLGGNKPIKVDFRLIAATNRNLKEDVKEKRFREDLYYRLNVVSINVLPLRERKEDIPELLEYFFSIYNELTGKKVTFILKEAKELLMEYSWPGNVRELENIIERAILLATDNIIFPEHLPEEIKKTPKDSPKLTLDIGLPLEMIEKEYILNTLKMVNWNQTESARLLKLHRNTLHRKIKKFNIDAPLWSNQIFNRDSYKS